MGEFSECQICWLNLSKTFVNHTKLTGKICRDIRYSVIYYKQFWKIFSSSDQDFRNMESLFLDLLNDFSIGYN